MLNLYLYSYGKILLTEPGTYSYDLSEWRRYILSTPAHNTITIDGKEQHRSDIFENRLAKEPLNNPWVTSPLFDYGKGVYPSGYQENKYEKIQYRPRKYVGEKDTSISHIRHVIFLKPYYYIVIDFLEGTGEHHYNAYFHLNAPDARVDGPIRTVHTLRSDTVQLGLFPMDIENMEVKIIKGQKEPILGWIPQEERPIPTVVYSKKEEAPCIFSTFLYPYLMEKPEVSYNKILSGNHNFWGKRINTPYESVAVIINKSSERTEIDINSEIIPTFSSTSDVILIRKPKDQKNDYLGFCGMTSFKDNKLALTLSFPSDLLIVKNSDQMRLFNTGNKSIEINVSLPFRGQVILPARKWFEVTPSGIKESMEKHKSDIKSLFK
jgi:hypothetical protein